jgi:histidine kinase/DNA gyrase B/HSP90-like ATPase/histidine kinase
MTRVFASSMAIGVSLFAGCRREPRTPPAVIEFSRIPQADPGGRETQDIIEGTVRAGKPGQQIVLYAKSGRWWIQPLVTHPFTKLAARASLMKWTNATHLGTEYAALLVEPVARDLHDTLLQTIQRSKMVTDNVLAGDPDQARMRSALERLSGWLGRAVQEGRVALNSLRSSATEQNDLAEALRRAGEEFRMERALEFDLFVEGKSWRMHPIVRDEVYRIAYEAIRNACTHSGGDHVVVKLTYGTNLILNIRDNGTGVEPTVAARGKDGHFGVIGMYERAQKLRAKLAISSLKGSGTEVELVVPRKFALLRSRG